MKSQSNDRVSWAIENITKERSFAELAAAVRAEGLELFEINGDYSLETIKALREFVIARPMTVFDGSINMCEIVRGDVPNIQIFGTAPKYACSRYYWRFGELLFNDRYAILPLGDLHRNPVVESLSRSSAVFIRPDSGAKQFQAGLIDIADASEFQTRHANSDMLVVVSTPKNITGEWRFICGQDGEIAAMSSYRINSLPILEPVAPEGAIDLCRRVLTQKYYPDVLFAVDICSDSDGTFWLLELNSFAGAGLYACDKRAIVRAVSRIL